MSDRKRNVGWRADNPNRHKREINHTPELVLNYTWLSDDKRKNTTEKSKRKS